MEGRLMPSVVEEGEDDADDLVISRTGNVNYSSAENEKENGDIINTLPRDVEVNENNSEDELENPADAFSEHYCVTYPSTGAVRGTRPITTLNGDQIHGAISDMYQWIKFKEVAIMLVGARICLCSSVSLHACYFI